MGASNGQEHRNEHRDPRYAGLRPPWKPGQSGNPGGRPKGRSLTSIFRDKLGEIDEGTGKTIAELLVDAWISEVRAGNTPALKEALDRTEGKVPDKIKATLSSNETTEDTLAIILTALEGFPEAKLAIARQLKESVSDSARNGDGSGPGDPDGDAWS